MTSLGSDLRYAARGLRHSPGFVCAAALTLALGIGANTAIFTVVYGVLLRPLPYSDPNRIVGVAASQPDESRSSLAPANFLDLQRDNRVFEHIAAYREDVFDLAGSGGNPQRLAGAQVTAGFFDVFSVPPVAGRTFHSAQDTPGRERVAVIAEGAWARAFGRDPAIVGSVVRINGEPVTVVGVMPAGFEWPRDASDIWVLAPKPVPTPPIDVPGDYLEQRGLSYFDAIARLRRDVTLEVARSDVQVVARRLATAFPENNAHRGFSVTPLKEQIVGDVRPALLMLLATVGLLLLIASANVAGLLVARAAGRRREVGIRTALGASRLRLVRQFLIESLLLSALGAALGLMLAYPGLRFLVAATPAESVPRLAEIGLDLRVLAFTIACAIVTALLFGLAPAVQASRSGLTAALKDGARGGTGTSHRLGALLIVGQVALTLVVLVGAGLLLNSFTRLQHVDPGFAVERVMAIELPLPQARYATPERQAAFYAEVRSRFASRREWRTAAIFPVPFGDGTDSSAPLRREGKPEPPAGRAPMVLLATATPNVFSTLGIRLLQGRDFTDQDNSKALPVAIVSAEMARRYWPGENPVGTRITLGGRDVFTVIGVVADVRRRALSAAPEPTVYLSYRQLTLPFMTLLVRTAGEPDAVVGEVRSAVRAIDPDLPLGDARTLRQRVASAVAEPRFRTLLVGLFAGLALALASVGVYGTISYSVAERLREMGIRLALGATPAQVLRTTMRRGVLLGIAGTLVGVAAAIPSMRLIASFLFGVGATDPLTFVVVIALLLGVAALASYLPARRAARVDPIIALRAE